MFKMSVRIAAAYLLLHRVRSILVILMITLSLWGLLFIEGIYDGMIEQMISNAIRSDCGHISLFAKGYRLDPDLNNQVRQGATIDRLLAEDSRVAGYVKRIKQDGLVATAHYSRGCKIVGIDLQEEEQHGRLAGYLEQGQVAFGKQGRGVLVGCKLAEKLQVRIGSKIIISGQDKHTDVAAAPFKVRGILKTNNLAIDGYAVFIDRNRMSRLLSLAGEVSQVAILLHQDRDIVPVQRDLQQKFPNLDVERWDEMYPALMQSRVMMQGVNMIISGLIFCVAGLGIFGVMLVSVLERMREFGIMLALGTRFRQISLIIFMESIFLGSIGFILGCLVGGVTLWYFKQYGLDLSMFSDAFDEFGMDAVTHAVIRPMYFITAFVAVLPAVFFSVLIPLRVLKKARPVEAITRI